MPHLGRHLPSEHHVEFRKAEDKRIVLLDKHDLDGIAQCVRQDRRQLEAAESGPEHYDSRLHVLLLVGVNLGLIPQRDRVLGEQDLQ